MKCSKELLVTMSCGEQMFELFSQFKCEETSVEDCERSGCPSTGHTDKNMEKVHKIINAV
jgi:hypothetical protein